MEKKKGERSICGKKRNHINHCVIRAAACEKKRPLRLVCRQLVQHVNMLLLENAGKDWIFDLPSSGRSIIEHRMTKKERKKSLPYVRIEHTSGILPLRLHVVRLDEVLCLFYRQIFQPSKREDKKRMFCWKKLDGSYLCFFTGYSQFNNFTQFEKIFGIIK